MSPDPSRLERWKATEPVRLYVYGWSLFGALLILAPAAFTYEHTGVVAIAVAVVLTWQAIGVEAARRSVYSAAGLLRRANMNGTERQEYTP